MSFPPSLSERRLLTLLAKESMSVDLLDHLGLAHALDNALIHNYVTIIDDVACVTATGRTAVKRPHVTPKKVANLLTAAKAALDYIKMVDAPVGLVTILSAAIADLDEQK
jgi:hypothetical protein